ncbi:MAG: radical SAM protein [Nitrospinae bacterium]|nr:radical SAM protein [Nitrospinota bacterium]
MSTIVFAAPPLTLEERYGTLAGAGNTLPSMGLLSLASVVRKSGYKTAVVEASSLNLSYDETVRQILSFSPDYVGITATTVSIFHAAKLAGKIKEGNKNIKVIIGGSHITALTKETLEMFPDFDFAAVGEGEETILELLNAFDNRGSFDDVKGIAYRKGQESGVGSRESEEVYIQINEKQDLIKDLDSIPFPAWDLLPDFPKAYHPVAIRCRKYPAAHLLTSRGCPHRCIFCDTSVFSRKYRAFSAEYILEMIKILYNKYGIREILFEDDVFVIFKKRLVEICEGLLKENLKISWSCLGRVHAVKPDILKLMKKAGCWQIGYGIESGDQKILDFAKKAITLEQVEEAVRWTKEAGIHTKGFFILGFPLETEESIINTIIFSKRIMLDDISANLMTPFPGSEIYNIADKYGKFNKDWSKMNMLQSVFIPNGLSEDKLNYYNKKMLKEFYLRPRIIGNYLLRMLENPRNAGNFKRRS